MLDLAVQQIGAILTPLYPTINVNELEFVLNDAQAKVVFVNDQDLYLKVISLKDRLPHLKFIYTFEHVANAAHWKELLQASTPSLVASILGISAKIGGEDLATIIYTSGTTGTPKGVMLSHRNVMTNVKASLPCFPPGEHMRALSFLPLNHILERMVTYLYLYKGTAIYYAESMDTIGDNLKEVKPHLFTTVPRLLEKVYDKILYLADLVGFQFFFDAEGNAVFQDPRNEYRIEHYEAEEKIFVEGNINQVVETGKHLWVNDSRAATGSYTKMNDTQTTNADISFTFEGVGCSLFIVKDTTGVVVS